MKIYIFLSARSGIFFSRAGVEILMFPACFAWIFYRIESPDYILYWLLIGLVFGEFFVIVLAYTLKGSKCSRVTQTDRLASLRVFSS